MRYKDMNHDHNKYNIGDAVEFKPVFGCLQFGTVTDVIFHKKNARVSYTIVLEFDNEEIEEVEEYQLFPDFRNAAEDEIRKFLYKDKE